jgi:hypothetical protein
MGLNYEGDKMKARHADQNYFNRIERRNGGEFPECNGFYEDCPEKPSLLDSKCRNCPQADDLPKPKIEWIDCEYCGEDAVPTEVGKKKDFEDTKCHICGKTNSAQFIKSQKVKE